jgi:NADH-quinone oxidoreductase subunit H
MVDFLTSQFGVSLIVMQVVMGVMMAAVAYCILLERKISAWVQDRIGPNRVGPKGLLQPIADGVKFLLKEDITSAKVDRPIFILAPAIAFTVALIAYAVIPWGGTIRLNGEPVLVQVASVDVGLLYILAVGSMSVYGIVLGGWASNNKFSFYGGMRATAQMLSYEIPMGLAILIVVMTTGHLRLENIVAEQIHGNAITGTAGAWTLLLHPAAFVILLITAFAESNRAPFDLAEAEQELIGGYQTEYSSMKMALFYLGEYAHMITVSAFIAVLFLGGWELIPFSERMGWGWLLWLNNAETIPAAICRFLVISGKIALFIVFFMWVRWTVPRFRFDQLMRLAWKGLVPLGLALAVWTGVLVYLGRPVTIWAPIGEAVIVTAALVVLALRKPEITGRQTSLPPVQAVATK